MPRFSPLGGFQAGLVAVMLTYAVIVLTQSISVEAFGVNSQTGQDEIAAPPSKAAMDELMKQKLTAAQGALEAISREDFDQLHESSLKMIALSKREIWEQMASVRFVQDTADFVSAVEFMDRMAAAQDAEGVTLGFVRVTMACSNCHRHMRSARVADLQRPTTGISSLLVSHTDRLAQDN
jgi:hypothetical protein